ncbi:MAG: hypothetical protein ACM3JJ_13710 [Hyphomicrobiales bacterium]
MLSAAPERTLAPETQEAKGPAAPGPYLRRYRAARPRSRRHGPIALAVLAVTLLLLGRVWQVTRAHALSKEHDELRREVRGLENRIRLSSDLAVQTAFREGLDYKAFAKDGFMSPDPSRVVDIDLKAPLPSVRPHEGAVASIAAEVGHLVAGLLPGPRRPSGEDAAVRPVSAGGSR